jgi:hypothetical protein
VISSTFDRPAEDHTTVAELAIERAKRLVELGHDVVILLDGITRPEPGIQPGGSGIGTHPLGRLSTRLRSIRRRSSWRGPQHRGGGSLTIVATALVETGSKMDEVIFEEFKGTGNSEIRLRREFAEKRIFPAIDVDASSTRREELLMSREEWPSVWKLRRVLSGLERLAGAGRCCWTGSARPRATPSLDGDHQDHSSQGLTPQKQIGGRAPPGPHPGLKRPRLLVDIWCRGPTAAESPLWCRFTP